MPRRKKVAGPLETLAEPASQDASQGLPPGSTGAVSYVSEDRPKSHLATPQHPKYQFAAYLPFKDGDTAYVDSETDGLDRFNRMVGCGLMNQHEEGTYIPMRHILGPANVRMDEAVYYLKEVLENPNIRKVFFNLKFDRNMLKKEGIELRGPVDDIAAQAPLLDENRLDYHLKVLSEQDAGMPPEEKDALVRWLRMNGHKDYEIWLAPSDLVGVYCYGDCLRTKRLEDVYRSKVVESGQWDVYETEAAIQPIVGDSELTGIRMDVPLLKSDRTRLIEEISQDNHDMCELVGNTAFNYDSPIHIAQFFTKLGFKPRECKKNASKISWDNEALARIKHPVAQKITDIKAKSNALAVIEELLSFVVGDRIYPHFHTFRKGDKEAGGAVTGRWSSSEPNLQNKPKPLRKYFIPDEGMVLLGIDYSQIEYRLFAHYSEDPDILGGYQADPWRDYHRAVALMMDVPRDPAKTLNFGLLFALGIKSLCTKLGLDPDNPSDLQHTKDLFYKYKRRFPSVQRLRDDVEKTGIERGWVRSVFGRIRRILDPAHAYKYLNSLCQGGAADLFKRGLRQMHPVCAKHGAVPLLYVHDEYVLQLPPENVDAFLRDAIPLLQEFPGLRRPLKVPIRVAPKIYRKNWAEGEEIYLHWNGHFPKEQTA